MDHRPVLQDTLRRLRARGASIPACMIGDSLSQASLPINDERAGSPLGAACLDTYRAMNGVRIAWVLEEPVLGAMGGGPTLPDTLFAAQRGGAAEEAEQQPGILWHGDEAPEIPPDLRRITFINTVPIRSEFMTLNEPEGLNHASFRDDGTPRPPVPDLTSCIALRFRHAGSDGLPGHLAGTNLEECRAKDPRLTWLEDR